MVGLAMEAEISAVIARRSSKDFMVKRKKEKKRV